MMIEGHDSVSLLVPSPLARVQWCPAWFLFLLCISILDWRNLARAQENGPTSTKREGPVEIVLTCDEGGRWEGRVELPSFQAGELCEFPLQVVNPTKLPLRFSRLELGCSCYEFNLSEKELTPGKAMRGRVKFQVPEHYHVSRFGVQADLISDSGENIGRLELTGEIAGNLHLAAPESSTLQLHGVTEFLLPLTISSPIKKENLIVEGLESFEGLDMVATVVERSRRLYLQVAAPNARQDGSIVSGRLRIKDSVTAKSIDCPMLFICQGHLDIVPSVARLRSVPKGDLPEIAREQLATSSSVLMGQFMVKVNQAAGGIDEAEEQEVKRDLDVVIRASCGGTPVVWTSVQLSPAIYRVKVYFAKDQVATLADKERVITWEVQVADKDVQHSSAFVLN